MNETLYIGKLLQKKMEEEGRKASWLAEKIHCDTSTIYRIYEQPYPESERLIKICILLEINLFLYYYEYVHEQIEKKKRSSVEN